MASAPAAATHGETLSAGQPQQRTHREHGEDEAGDPVRVHERIEVGHLVDHLGAEGQRQVVDRRVLGLVGRGLQIELADELRAETFFSRTDRIPRVGRTPKQAIALATPRRGHSRRHDVVVGGEVALAKPLGMGDVG